MNNDVRKVVWGGFYIVLGIILPQLLHFLGGQYIGQALLPMHLPVFLAGMTLGPLYGLLVGAIIPVLSSLLTGMPPFSPPIAILMLLELAAYGLFSGWLYIHLKKNVFLALAISMIVGRIVFGLALVLVAPFFGFNPPFWNFMQGSLATGIPGVVLQFIVIPLLVDRMNLKERINQGA